MLTDQIPSHIPSNLVFDYDRFHQPELTRCPHQRISQLFSTLPPIFYTPRNGGHWVIARSGEAMDMLKHPEIFSSNPALNPFMQRSPRTAPNQYDPPEHDQLRAVINRFFDLKSVANLEPVIRSLAARLINAHLAKGKVEFLSEIGQRYPVELFLNMAGAPLDDRDQLLRIVERFTRLPELDDRLAALRELADQMQSYLKERVENPKDDLLTAVTQAKFTDRPLTSEEQLGFAALLFLGGLDTVAAMLSFIMAYLGLHPEQYDRLKENPNLIPRAVEELMRVHGVAAMERAVANDTTYAGIEFRKGDRMLFMPQIYGLDSPRLEDPYEVKFDRKASPQMIFGAGAHRCIGANLAVSEIRIFLEEWVKRIPSFQMEGGEAPQTHSGIVWSPVTVPLTWDPATTTDCMLTREEV